MSNSEVKDKVLQALSQVIREIHKTDQELYALSAQRWLEEENVKEKMRVGEEAKKSKTKKRF